MRISTAGGGRLWPRPQCSPSLSPSHFHHGADVPLRSAHLCAFQRSNLSDAPSTMALDRDKFLHPDEQVRTLREHDVALSLIEKMDEFWLYDNVLRTDICSSRSCQESAFVSPFQSIQMVRTEVICDDVKRSSVEEFPRKSFHKKISHRISDPMIKSSPCGDRKCFEGERLDPDLNNVDAECRGIPLEASVVVHKASRLNVTAELSEPLSHAADSDEVAVRKLKQAEEKIPESNSSPVKKQWDSARSKPVNIVTAEPVKKCLIPLAPETAKLHLSRQRRIRKEAKNKPRGVEHFVHDEMRGFKELGFSFSQEKLTPRVIGMFPELKAVHGEGKNYPKLSHVASSQYNLCNIPPWWTIKPDSPLYNWQFPDPNQEGVDMKAHLKFWARAVASTVRQEC